MANLTQHDTLIAGICNESQVSSVLDSFGIQASKLWNVGCYTARRVWSECGEIPGDDVLKSYLKTHETYRNINSQSAQRVLEELAEAFRSWYGHRRNGNTGHNPPGYRKHHHPDGTASHPKSTLTWKQNGFKVDTKNNRIRLSKSQQTKQHQGDYILVEYETRPGVEVNDVQQVRAVHKNGSWQLHIVCKHEIDAESPGTKTAGVDLGICNIAAVSYNGEEGHLYPGNAFKEDEYYFLKEIARCDSSGSREAKRLHHIRSERASHYIHAVTRDIIELCVEKGVGRLRVGNPKHIREDEDGNPRDWGPHGNLDLHRWPFHGIYQQLSYKGARNGITVEAVDERDTSRTCCNCGKCDHRNRVERGLYDCSRCHAVANSDVGGAENIRTQDLEADGGFHEEMGKQVTQSSLLGYGMESPETGGDMSTGWLAQPVVNRFRRGERGNSSEAGTFERVSDIHEP